MTLKMRPGFYKDDVDYSVFCGEWCIGRIYEKHSSPDAGGRPMLQYLPGRRESSLPLLTVKRRGLIVLLSGNTER